MLSLRRHGHSVGEKDSLAELTVGTTATIIGPSPVANDVIVERLWYLGFRPDAQVEVVRRAPLGDPTVYRVANTEICLRRAQARQLTVEYPTP